MAGEHVALRRAITPDVAFVDSAIGIYCSLLLVLMVFLRRERVAELPAAIKDCYG